MLRYALIALTVASACVIIKVEYLDARPVGSSVVRPGDVVITVKRHQLYVTQLQARERALAIAIFFIGTFGAVIVGRQLRL
jgi:hypothetical protein